MVHVAGNDSCGYSGDGGLAIHAAVSRVGGICRDAAGNLYFTDQSSAVARVRKIAAAMGTITTIASFSLVSATGICIDIEDNMYIADGGTRIRKMNLATYIIGFIGRHCQSRLLGRWHFCNSSGII